jgi:hypothetical protein
MTNTMSGWETCLKGVPTPELDSGGGTLNRYAVCSCRCMAFSLNAW